MFFRFRRKFFISLIFFFFTTAYTSEKPVEFNIFNSSYIYNGENASYWEETRYTLTYLEDLFQPYFTLKSGNVIFKIGVGLFFPFNQEEKLISYYPYFQTRYTLDDFVFIIGVIDNDHDFPPCILDPLVRMTPKVRIVNTDQIPIDYESFPTGIFTHGFYEYGVQIKSSNDFLKLDTYLNWQLPDTSLHRERFDIGLIVSLYSFYTGIHYWHNGGHENFHPVEVTENYVASLGLKEKNFSLFYLVSYWLPDRDRYPEKNVLGQAIYIEGNFEFFGINIQPQFFITSAFIFKEQSFISVEGDPFYRVPLYVGLNFSKVWNFGQNFIELKFVNGTFLPDTSTGWNPMMIRYDQKIQFNFNHKFEISTLSNS